MKPIMVFLFSSRYNVLNRERVALTNLLYTELINNLVLWITPISIYNSSGKYPLSYFNCKHLKQLETRLLDLYNIF